MDDQIALIPLLNHKVSMQFKPLDILMNSFISSWVLLKRDKPASAAELRLLKEDANALTEDFSGERTFNKVVFVRGNAAGAIEV